MSLAEVADPVRRCPEPAVLAAFNLGRLPLPTLEAIAGHLSTCPECGSLLQDLQQQSDSLLGKLRVCDEQDTLEGESACAKMEARARGIEVSLGATLGQDATGTPATDTEAPLPVQIGPYVVLERIGRGGMGVVYKARQTPVNRLVALKMISSGAHASTQVMARFQVEGQAIARLQHANVIQIYDFGQHEGLPYYSMELAEGGSLSKRLADRPLPVREAAEVVRALAQAVQYAHEQQVLHRDLKPSNILLGAGGLPKVSDFGLAKLLDNESGHTLSEAVLGTPSYMAPEQAEGKTGAIGPAADLYALGAILYECLTGRPPFRGKDKAETLQMVRLVEPEAPSRRRAEVPRDLEAVCLKCLEKDPARRYLSAEELAKDLDRWLAGEPTLAQPQRWPSRAWRRVRRHPMLVGLTLGLVALLGAVPALAPDPDRPLRELEQELTQGRPVTLIDASGKPRWFRVRSGEGKPHAAAATDNGFAVNTWGIAMVELLPSTPCDRYQLRAQVRHTRSTSNGAAGIYFAASSYPGPSSEIYVYTSLHYNEVVPQKFIWDRIPFKNKPPPPKGNQVRMDVLITSASAKDNTSIGHRGQCLAGGLFQPAGTRDGPWRELTVTVTPENIFAQLGGEDGTAIGNLPVAQAVKNLDQGLTLMRKNFPDEPLIHGIPATISLRGGIGLYLVSGSAYFRSVEITPLGEAN